MDENPTTALYSESTKPEIVFDETKDIKNAETAKPAHVKSYAHSYPVEILNFFNPEMQLKNNEFTIKNKLKIELRNFKFAVTLD